MNVSASSARFRKRQKAMGSESSLYLITKETRVVWYSSNINFCTYQFQFSNFSWWWLINFEDGESLSKDSLLFLQSIHLFLEGCNALKGHRCRNVTLKRTSRMKVFHQERHLLFEILALSQQTSLEFVLCVDMQKTLLIQSKQKTKDYNYWRVGPIVKTKYKYRLLQT